jgi:hypothetical protein
VVKFYQKAMVIDRGFARCLFTTRQWIDWIESIPHPSTLIDLCGALKENLIKHKTEGTRNISFYSSNDGIFIIIYFSHLLHMFYYGPAIIRCLSRFGCFLARYIRNKISHITVACLRCIGGCWLMEDTIMAPILNFYGTFPKHNYQTKLWRWKMLPVFGHKYRRVAGFGEIPFWDFVREISQLWKFQKCLYFIVFPLLCTIKRGYRAPKHTCKQIPNPPGWLWVWKMCAKSTIGERVRLGQ